MSWRDHAACRDMDPDAFHPDEGRMSKARRASLEAAAKTLCALCPVTQPCLEDALADPVGMDLGIRGCTNSDERRQIRRQRGEALALSASEHRALGAAS